MPSLATTENRWKKVIVINLWLWKCVSIGGKNKTVTLTDILRRKLPFSSSIWRPMYPQLTAMLNQLNFNSVLSQRAVEKVVYRSKQYLRVLLFRLFVPSHKRNQLNFNSVLSQRAFDEIVDRGIVHEFCYSGEFKAEL